MVARVQVEGHPVGRRWCRLAWVRGSYSRWLVLGAGIPISNEHLNSGLILLED